MSIYQHFRTEERDFVDQVIHWKEFVEDTYGPKLTDFLDPREQQIVQMIIGTQSGMGVKFFGGSEVNERKRAFIFPEYYKVESEDFQIQLHEINYPSKFVTIEHPQVLGSLMSIGLKRGKFGDILVQDGRVQFFSAKEVSDYIKLQLTSIGRSTVSLEEVPLRDALKIGEVWQEYMLTVSSLRLDTVLSALHNLSRQKSQIMIQQGLIKVNWTIIENPAFECGESDVISARGYGRAKIISIEGKTKKDKWRILAGKQK